MSIGSSGNGAAGAPLELPLVADPPRDGVIGVVVRFGGVTVVPATEIVSPIDTGPIEMPEANDAGAVPAAGVTGAVAAIVGVAAGEATGYPGNAAVELETDGELAAGVPTVEFAGAVMLVGVTVLGAKGAMLPPVTPPADGAGAGVTTGVGVV